MPPIHNGERVGFGHSQYPEFTSPKINGKVIYRRRWQLIALIQLSLDPGVEQIKPVNLALQRLACPEIEVSSKGTWRTVSFCDKPDPACVKCRKHSPHGRIVRDDAMQELRRRNCFDIYNAARLDVPVDFRLRILEVLNEHKGRAQLAELLSAVKDFEFNGATGILAMAWLGLIQIPLEVSWTPATYIELSPGTNLAAQEDL